MPVVNVCLAVDDKVYEGVVTGAFELCGLVKNADNHKVVKHIPTVLDAAKQGAAKAIDVFREHRTGAIVIGSLLLVGGVSAGVVNYVVNRRKNKLEHRFAKALQDYLDAAKAGQLTAEVLDELIGSLEVFVNQESDKPVELKVPATQINELVNAVFDYTQRLARANHIDTASITRPKAWKKKDASDLQYYLKVQKGIFEQAA